MGNNQNQTRFSGAFVAISITLLTLTGCSLFDSTLDFFAALPNLPPEVSEAIGGIRFRVSFPSLDGGVLRTWVPEGVEGISISTPAKSVVPVLAFAVPTRSGGGELLPAGGIFPLHLDPGGSLILSWIGGFETQILHDLAAAGFPIEAVNAHRLSESVRLKSENNPWRLDRRAIINGFLYGGLRESSIRLYTDKHLTLPISDGLWYRDNLIESTPLLAEGEGLKISGIRNGMQSFFKQGLEEWIDLYCDDSGWSLFNRTKGTAITELW